MSTESQIRKPTGIPSSGSAKSEFEFVESSRNRALYDVSSADDSFSCQRLTVLL